MGMVDRYNGNCFLCRQDKPVRYIDLYVIGSEGLVVCHSCEMELVQCARDIQTREAYKRRDAFLQQRRQQKATETLPQSV